MFVFIALIGLTCLFWRFSASVIPRSLWYLLYGAFVANGFAEHRPCLGIAFVLSVLSIRIFCAKVSLYIWVLLGSSWMLWAHLLFTGHR